MIIKKFVLFALFVSFAGIGYGQQPLETNGNIQQETLHINIDSIARVLLQKGRADIDSILSGHVYYKYLPDRSYFVSNPLFMDLIFTGLKLNFNPPEAPLIAQMHKQYKLYDKRAKSYFSPQFFIVNYLDSLRAWQKEQLIVANPNHIRTHVWNLPDPQSFTPHYLATPGRRDLILKRKFEPTKPKAMIVIGIEKAPWSTKGTVLGQLSQNYTSSNWYQGGKSNLAALFVLEENANYDDQKSIQFDNNLSIKMGLQSESADTIRHHSVTENQIRLSSKFGVKAFENWYYSISGEFTTYSLTSYSALNSRTKVNGFLSPFRLDLGLGMDYKYKKELSVLVTPLSFKYIHFSDTLNYNIKNFGVTPGKKSLQEFGSLVKVEYTKKLSGDIDVASRFSFYTNYNKIEVDWETSFNFMFNRYLSMRATIHPRYDTSVIQTGSQRAKIQFKELMSFGFAYKFNNIRARNKRVH